MGLVLGRKPERETLRFSGKVGAADDAGQLCDAGAGWDRSDVFLLCRSVMVAPSCFRCVCVCA